MTTTDHTDQLDRRLEQAHRVFQDDHDALRQELLDRLDQAHGDPPVGANPLPTSNTRKWMMRSSLAAAAVILIVVGVTLFGTGPGSPAIAWAQVRENVENATAMHYRQAVVVLDAEGNVVRELSGSENWSTDDGRTRAIQFDPLGEKQHEMIHTKDASLILTFGSAHAMLNTSEWPGDPGHAGAGGADGATDSGPLEMLLRVTDAFAVRTGEDRVGGRSAVRFSIAMDDLIAYQLRERGVQDPDAIPVEAAFGGSAEELAKLPPMQVWIDGQTNLPLRMQMPMADAMADAMGVALPEGGGLAVRFAFLGWNEQVDDAVFEIAVPRGWAVDRNHTVFLGGRTDLTPNDPERVTAGLPLAGGVAFRLFDDKGELVATEQDVLGVTRLARRTGHGKGAEQDAWETRVAKLRFTDAVARRIDSAVSAERDARWSYTLGETLAGTVRVMRVRRGSIQNAPTHGGELEGIGLGDLTFDQFIRRFLEPQ